MIQKTAKNRKGRNVVLPLPRTQQNSRVIDTKHIMEVVSAKKSQLIKLQKDLKGTNQLFDKKANDAVALLNLDYANHLIYKQTIIKLLKNNIDLLNVDIVNEQQKMLNLAEVIELGDDIYKDTGTYAILNVKDDLLKLTQGESPFINPNYLTKILEHLEQEHVSLNDSKLQFFENIINRLLDVSRQRTTVAYQLQSEIDSYNDTIDGRNTQEKLSHLLYTLMKAGLIDDQSFEDMGDSVEASDLYLKKFLNLLESEGIKGTVNLAENEDLEEARIKLSGGAFNGKNKYINSKNKHKKNRKKTIKIKRGGVIETVPPELTQYNKPSTIEELLYIMNSNLSIQDEELSDENFEKLKDISKILKLYLIDNTTSLISKQLNEFIKKKDTSKYTKEELKLISNNITDLILEGLPYAIKLKEEERNMDLNEKKIEIGTSIGFIMEYSFDIVIGLQPENNPSNWGNTTIGEVAHYLIKLAIYLNNYGIDIFSDIGGASYPATAQESQVAINEIMKLKSQIDNMNNYTNDSVNKFGDFLVSRLRGNLGLNNNFNQNNIDQETDENNMVWSTIKSIGKVALVTMVMGAMWHQTPTQKVPNLVRKSNGIINEDYNMYDSDWWNGLWSGLQNAYQEGIGGNYLSNALDQVGNIYNYKIFTGVGASDVPFTDVGVSEEYAMKLNNSNPYFTVKSIASMSPGDRAAMLTKLPKNQQKLALAHIQKSHETAMAAIIGNKPETIYAEPVGEKELTNIRISKPGSKDFIVQSRDPITGKQQFEAFAIAVPKIKKEDKSRGFSFVTNLVGITENPAKNNLPDSPNIYEGPVTIERDIGGLRELWNGAFKSIGQKIHYVDSDGNRQVIDYQTEIKKWYDGVMTIAKAQNRVCENISNKFITKPIETVEKGFFFGDVVTQESGHAQLSMISDYSSSKTKDLIARWEFLINDSEGIKWKRPPQLQGEKTYGLAAPILENNQETNLSLAAKLKMEEREKLLKQIKQKNQIQEQINRLEKNLKDDKVSANQKKHQQLLIDQLRSDLKQMPNRPIIKKKPMTNDEIDASIKELKANWLAQRDKGLIYSSRIEWNKALDKFFEKANPIDCNRFSVKEKEVTRLVMRTLEELTGIVKIKKDSFVKEKAFLEQIKSHIPSSEMDKSQNLKKELEKKLTIGVQQLDSAIIEMKEFYNNLDTYISKTLPFLTTFSDRITHFQKKVKHTAEEAVENTIGQKKAELIIGKPVISAPAMLSSPGEIRMISPPKNSKMQGNNNTAKLPNKAKIEGTTLILENDLEVFPKGVTESIRKDIHKIITTFDLFAAEVKKVGTDPEQYAKTLKEEQQNILKKNVKKHIEEMGQRAKDESEAMRMQREVICSSPKTGLFNYLYTGCFSFNPFFSLERVFYTTIILIVASLAVSYKILGAVTVNPLNWFKKSQAGGKRVTKKRSCLKLKNKRITLKK